jgi:protein-S-isoprenylcysteine O-methyltransferase Ste14
MANDLSTTAGKIRIGLRVLVYLFLPVLLLFGLAGDWGWGAGWLYVAITLLSALVSRILTARKHPDLLRERAASLNMTDVKPWDRKLVPLVAMVGPMLMLVVAGLDKRFGWSGSLPAFLPVIGLLGVLTGVVWGVWAMVVNRFFSAMVRIQTDRGHQVVSAGPYRVMRHPGYMGGCLSNLGIPLMFGSYWALIPGAVVIILIIMRTALEDRTLQAELPGYAEYARRVRYRLLPGVW